MTTPFNRTRFRTVPKSSFFTKLDKGLNSSFPDIFTDLSSTTIKGEDVEYMSDVVTPGWALKRSRGEILNNPMSRFHRQVEYASGNFNLVATHPSYQAYSYPEFHRSGQYMARLESSAPPVIPLIRDTSVAPAVIDEEHFIKLAAIKARQGISPILVQSLVSAAELPKTLSLIGSSLSTLRQIRKSVVTGNPDYALRAIGNQRSKKVRITANYSRKTVHDRWLEFRYGWTPLVFEVQGAMKALNRPRGEIKPPRATSRGFENAAAENSSVFNWNAGSNGLFSFHYARKKTLSVRAYVLYTAELKHQQARDFGVTELPLAAWELVPYSFVVDWFVNIGNWIEALTPKLGINILAEGYTLRKTDVLTRTFASWTKQIVNNESWDGSGSMIGSKDTFSQSDYQRVPSLDVLYSLPPLNVKLDKKRLLDAIALMSKQL